MIRKAREARRLTLAQKNVNMVTARGARFARSLHQQLCTTHEILILDCT